MSGDVQFKIDGKTYDTSTVDEISLRDVVLFNGQAAAMGLPVTWVDVERVAGEMATRTKAQGPHPDALLMFAVTVWAARRIAGDDVTLDEALDVPMSRIEIVEARKAPKDHQSKKRKRPPARQVGGPGTVTFASPPNELTTPATSSGESVSA